MRLENNPLSSGSNEHLHFSSFVCLFYPVQVSDDVYDRFI